MNNLFSYSIGKEKVLITLLIIFMPLSIGGIASFNAAIEEEELILIPVEKERNWGRKIDEKVKKHFDEPADPLMQKRISEIGRKLAKCTDRRDIVYRFTVLNDKKDDNYNAFAAPGGYIYIFDDLVEALGTDDNIAAVLAHEMGHVEAKHSVKRFQGSIGLTALMLLGSQVPSEPGEYAEANKALGHLMAHYSRHDERQSDKLSVKYTEGAGYDPYGAVKSLEVLKDLRKKGPRMRYHVLKSHPYISERISYIKKILDGGADFDSYINMVSEKDGL